MNRLSFIHLELTSRCNKGDGTLGSGCWMCGRRKLEKDYPELTNWGDMPKEMVYEIAKEIPKGIVCQFHNNGEPLLYPHLGYALSLFKKNIRSFNTNAKILLEKSDEIIGNLETLTISVVQDDPEQEEQYDTVVRFLEKKGSRNPRMVYRCLGKIPNRPLWERLCGIVSSRVLHSPEGSFAYEKTPTIPEIGICLDLLTHLAIDRFGNISLCVRFDPQGELRIGHVKEGIEKAWNSEKRKFYIQKHIEQKRAELPGCDRCEYWGIPRGD